MFDQYKNLLSLEESKWNEFKGCFSRHEISSRQIILHEGEVSSKAFVIEKGCLRAWISRDGTDKTCQFFFENGIVASIESFRKNIPSLINVEAVGPCTVWSAGKKDVNRMFSFMDENPAMRKIIYDLILERTFIYMKNYLSFITDTPLQRYQKLIADHPQILLRVPQHHIASYLGISPVHLSRIKNAVPEKSRPGK